MSEKEKILILDTEVNGKFVYDIGFIIAEESEKGFYHAVEKHQFLVEQIYYNHRLFTTDYYAKKRKTYTKLMKGRNAISKKFGYITQIIAHTIKKHDIKKVYAYNSNYDKTRFAFTSNDFKVINPFDKIEWHDIMAISNHFIHLSEKYINFAIENEYINSSGFIETTAETTYQFVDSNIDFKEEHTSLADCEIEMEILNYCIAKGYNKEQVYKTKNIPSDKLQVLTVIHESTEHKFGYVKRKNSYLKNQITLT